MVSELPFQKGLGKYFLKNKGDGKWQEEKRKRYLKTN